MFQQFQNLRQNQNDPKEMINNIVGKYKPEQVEQFRQYAKGFGITDEQLTNYGINAK